MTATQIHNVVAGFIMLAQKHAKAAIVCTGNRTAQCADGANYAAKKFGKGCFPRRGNAKDIFANADPAKWRKIRNSSTNVPPEGAIVVFGARPGNPYGHVGIARRGCTRTTLYTVEVNWSVPHCWSLERHAGYRTNNVIGWLVPR